MGTGGVVTAQTLRDVLRTLAAMDVTELSDESLRTELTHLVAASSQLDAVIGQRLTTFEQRNLAEIDGLRTTRTWLRGFTHLSDAAAGGLLRRARVLTELPTLAEAALGGTVTPDHVMRVAALTDRVGAGITRTVEPSLVEAARMADPAVLSAVCHQVRVHTDTEGAEPPPEVDFDRRGLSLNQFDGMLLVRGQFDAEGAATIQSALDAAQKPPAATDERTPAQHRADALVRIAREWLAGPHRPTVGGARPQVGVLITAATLTGSGSPGATAEPAHLDWVGPVSTALAQRLACDADIFPVAMHDKTGLPLYLGRTQRTVPPWLRRALHARDRGCRWPGCSAPTPWTDGHHITPWYHGGATDITNLVSLCRWHHRLVHEGQWRLRLDPATGEVTVTRPDGRPYELGPSRPWVSPAVRRGDIILAARTDQPKPDAHPP
jgi:hypothetical protein